MNQNAYKHRENVTLINNSIYKTLFFSKINNLITLPNLMIEITNYKGKC